MKRTTFRFFLLLTLSVRILAAPTIEDFQSWDAIQGQGSFDVFDPDLQKFRWWIEGQARFYNDGDHLGQAIVRPGLGYALAPDASVWLGYAWIPNRIVGKPDFDEHRIWQQFSWSSSTDLGMVSTRSRLEQRFTDQGSNTGWRFRQQVKFVYPLAFEPRLSLVAWDEIFVNINNTNWGVHSGIDQNRIFGGFGWNFDEKKHFRAEIGYLNQYIQAEQAADKMNHVLSATLFFNY